MKPFYIFNSLNRAVEEFQPQKPPEVTLYSCGPTVYLPQHLGNLRAYVFVDSLRRALEFNGYRVRHVMNVTDVGHMTSDEDAGEDKIEKTARAQGKSPLEVANFYLEQFQRDCATLNLEPPQVWSRATDHIGDMIALIQRIIDAGVAYVTKSGVYFDVEKYRGENRVGRLSRQSLDEQDAAQRLEHSADKHSPHDFTLWVLGQPGHLMQWDSPWGRGYPGWHIECSAMAMKYLGETIDIHTGGIDHIPVHHENEIAQSESATHQPFARYFVHNAFLVGKEGTKISKSAGKFPLLSDLGTAGIDPLAFRIFCYGAKYRSEIAFNDESLHAAQSNLDYFREFARSVPDDAAADGVEAAGWAAEYYERFHDAINNDLNTPQAIGGGARSGRGSIPAQGFPRMADAAGARRDAWPRPGKASHGSARRFDRARRAAVNRQPRRSAQGQRFRAGRRAPQRNRTPRLRSQRQPRRHGELSKASRLSAGAHF